ncbi:MAG TPA: 30S ribosomal protein S20 [Eubacteriaceae bacterium]|jgi:small subunit ribosomal protein S20|nr:30S ribosomal protein S20 [Eubacteriaceae bacterium]
MANIKSAIKRVRVAEFKTNRNKMVMSNLKTTIRKFNNAVENEDKELSKELYREVTKKLDKAASKGIIHANTAARRKSNLAKKIKTL